MAAPPLPGVLADLAPVLDHWGYLAVATLLFLEDFGVPVPGETVMIAAAVYAGTGRMNVVAVVAIAFLAAACGDNVGYAIGRFGGHRLLTRWGRCLLLTEARLARAEGFFTHHGGKIVTVARFIEGLRQVNGIIAGLTEMPWRRFLACNALGAGLWVGAWVTLGDLAGAHLNTLYPAIQRYELYLLAATAVIVAALVARHLHRRPSTWGDGALSSRRGRDGEPSPAALSSPSGREVSGHKREA